LNYENPHSIGRVKAFLRQFRHDGPRALSYIYTHGAEGLKEATETAVLNARYVSRNLKDVSTSRSNRLHARSDLFRTKISQERAWSRSILPSGLIDYGFHPPTFISRSVVEGAMLIEPTESVGRADLDAFHRSDEGYRPRSKR
jgi:glycine dehydrogenase subunit 2